MSHGPEDRTPNERCIIYKSAPPVVIGADNHVQIFQTRDTVAFLHKRIHEAIIVPLDGRPPHLTAPPTPRLRVTERFARVDADTLRYEFTVDDPDTFLRPWTARWAMRRTEGLE